MSTVQRVLVGAGQDTSSNRAQTLTEDMLAQISQLIRSQQSTVTILQSRARYIHHQDIPATEWRINHGLDGMPAHMIVDATGHLVYGDVFYLNQQQSLVQYGSPFSGIAYLLN